MSPLPGVSGHGVVCLMGRGGFGESEDAAARPMARRMGR